MEAGEADICSGVTFADLLSYQAEAAIRIPLISTRLAEIRKHNADGRSTYKMVRLLWRRDPRLSPHATEALLRNSIAASLCGSMESPAAFSHL